jgi:hypothetical protein
MLQTEFEFTLPVGFQSEDGSLIRHGVMRRATAADEILPLKDPRVKANSAYLVIILLSRVITELGSVSPITPRTIETLYATDLAFLQELYNEVNQLTPRSLPITCPSCDHQFLAEAVPLGGS